MKSKTKQGRREPGAPDAGLSDRQAKQAAALKANLQRRKQQAKARAADAAKPADKA